MTTEPPDKKTRPYLNPAIVAALIGAVATVSVAFIGNRGGFTSILPGSPTRTVTASSSPQATVTVPVPITSSTAPQIRNKGPLTLTPNGGADLDSTDKNWGNPGSSCEVQDIDLYSAGPNTSLDGSCGSGQFTMVPRQAPATYNTCADATGFMQDIPGGSVHPGIKFCVYTSEHRFALVEVVDSDPKTGDNGLNRVDLYVVSWQPQSSSS